MKLEWLKYNFLLLSSVVDNVKSGYWEQNLIPFEGEVVLKDVGTSRWSCTARSSIIYCHLRLSLTFRM